MAFENLGGAGVLGFLMMMGAAMMVVGLVLYIYFAVALMAIAKKTNTPNGWLAFIPIANIYLMTQMAGMPAWLTLAFLLPFIPFIGGLAFAVVSVYLFWKIAEKIGKPGWWSILLLIPVVNLVIIGIMAWGK